MVWGWLVGVGDPPMGDSYERGSPAESFLGTPPWGSSENHRRESWSLER